MAEPTPSLGSVLAEARKQARLSLKEVAAHIKKEDGSPITPQYLNDIEHDRRTPSPEVLDGLAAYFRLSASYLYFLAGAWPADVKRLAVSEDQFAKAYQAFRKKLEN